MTDVVMISSHRFFLLPFAIIYGPVNYYETKKAGKPLYSFLTWKDHTSVLIYVGLVIATLFAFSILAKVTHLVKRGSIGGDIGSELKYKKD
jgi:hypothetical protein